MLFANFQTEVFLNYTENKKRTLNLGFESLFVLLLIKCLFEFHWKKYFIDSVIEFGPCTQIPIDVRPNLQNCAGTSSRGPAVRYK
jgi:hypothetical protein